MKEITITFAIYIESRTRRVRLEKSIKMSYIPRVGECMKFKNEEEGDYFGWRISSITYRERNNEIYIMTEIMKTFGHIPDEESDKKENEEEFDSLYSSYIKEGWISPFGT